MRVVVTGASGNVGTTLLDQMEADERVTSIVGISRRAPAETRSKVTWATVDVGAEDLRDLLPHLQGADVLVHLAWLFQPTHRPEVTWQANAVGSQRVFEAATAAGVGAVVYASSVGAYSPPGRRGDAARVTESWPTHSLPTAAYGREKAYVERVLDAFAAEHPDVRVVRLRPGFIFQRPAATQQRRLFAGPFVPRWAVEPGRLPFLPVPSGLRFQAVHAEDAARAYHLAATTDVEGAFNVAAEPVIDGDVLAGLLGTRAFEVPPVLMRTGVAAAWHAHLTPAEPALLDLVLQLPLLDTTRAHEELGWRPERTAVEAVQAMLEGLLAGAGARTPPLAPDTAAGRLREVATGVGERP